VRDHLDAILPADHNRFISRTVVDNDALCVSGYFQQSRQEAGKVLRFILGGYDNRYLHGGEYNGLPALIQMHRDYYHMRELVVSFGFLLTFFVTFYPNMRLGRPAQH